MQLNKLLATSIDELTFSVVDTETTGMNPNFNRVMDIGIVTIKNGEIINKWETLINPNQNIDYWITFYTNITNSHVLNKPPFDLYAPKISTLLSDTIFVGHNVEFDYSFIKSEMLRSGQSFDFPKLCTVLLSRKLLPQLSHANLDFLSAYYGINITARHRALPDAEATAEILLKFIEIAKDRFNAKTYFDLAKLQHLKQSKTDNLTTSENGSLFE